jgi:hypothetical protein
MFIDFISRILGAEKVSVSNRQEKVTTPDVIEKSSTNNQAYPEKYKKDIKALLDKYGDVFKTGLCINLTLQEALSIMPRERRRIDAYRGLQSYLKRELGITLSITSQKSKL